MRRLRDRSANAIGIDRLRFRYDSLRTGQCYEGYSEWQVNPSEYLSFPRHHIGVLAWSRRVVDFWKAQDYQIESHTDAFNQAIQKFGCESFKLDYYYDISNWSDYEELITNVLPLHG